MQDQMISKGDHRCYKSTRPKDLIASGLYRGWFEPIVMSFCDALAPNGVDVK